MWERLVRWLDMRRQYKKILHEVLTEIDRALVEEATEEVYGTYITGKKQVALTVRLLEEYFKRVKEKYNL